MKQIKNFKTSSEMNTEKITKELNSMVPGDIVIIKSKEVELNFHSQYDAQSKTDIYKILNRSSHSAINRKRVWHIPYQLNFEKMQNAAKYLIGEHDFKVFSKTGSSIKTTVRNIHKASFHKHSDEIIEFNIQANGFLTDLVRLIVVTIFHLGKEKLTEPEFKH